MIDRFVAARLRPVLIAGLIGLSLAIAPAGAPTAAAASDGLALTSSTTYTLVPAARAVRVAVDVSAANQKPNRVSGGVVTRYFYDSFALGVQPEARAIRASSGGTSLAVRTKAADGYTRVEVDFAHSLFFHDTAKVHVTFELPGGAPRSASEIRVGPAFATFDAWAFGDSGSVRIVVPKDFDPATQGAPVTRSTVGDSTVLSAAVSDVSSWYVVVNADRPSGLTDVDVRLRDGEELRIRAWPDDPTWKSEVTDLLTRGLPELVNLIGLSWPVSGAITVTEVHTPLLEGYAGVFYTGSNRIEVSEDLDDLTIVHEASHAWFNADLFTGRWINEGFADTFASEALDAIGLSGSVPGRVTPDDRAGVKLNAWVSPGRITDDETDAREQFGYDASWTVIRTIANEIGIDRMREVLGRAEARSIAYAGAGTPEAVAGPADWRRLLDLFDEVGHSTTADGLFRTWVVTSSDLALLDARDTARQRYAALLQQGAGWLPPALVRQPMADWNFPVATSRIADAEAILQDRDRIADQAARLGLTVPAGLRSAYESASGTLDDATAIASRELTELAAIQAATDAVRAPRDPLVALGLVGADPELRLAEADAAFAADAPDPVARAQTVLDIVGDAANVGRQRLFVGIVAVDLLFGATVIIVVAGRRRQRRLVARATARSGQTADGPYATLAAPSGGPPTPPQPPITGDES